MYTSDIKDKLKAGMRYLAASVLIAAAAAVYGLFSHGVYSYYMTYAFMIPLLGGAVPYLASALKDMGKHDGPVTETDGIRRGRIAEMQLAVIATLTAGSVLKGVLDIYGTSNRLLIVYPVIAVIMAAAAAIRWRASLRAN